MVTRAGRAPPRDGIDAQRRDERKGGSAQRLAPAVGRGNDIRMTLEGTFRGHFSAGKGAMADLFLNAKCCNRKPLWPVGGPWKKNPRT